MPAQAEIDALLPLVGWSKVHWVRPMITLPAGMQIDFGGIGKEYAVDQAMQLVAQMSSAAVLVNFGGDLAVTRSREGNRAWRVGIESIDAAVRSRCEAGGPRGRRAIYQRRYLPVRGVGGSATVTHPRSAYRVAGERRAPLGHCRRAHLHQRGHAHHARHAARAGGGSIPGIRGSAALGAAEYVKLRTRLGVATNRAIARSRRRCGPEDSHRGRRHESHPQDSGRRQESGRAAPARSRQGNSDREDTRCVDRVLPCDSDPVFLEVQPLTGHSIAELRREALELQAEAAGQAEHAGARARRRSERRGGMGFSAA